MKKLAIIMTGVGITLSTLAAVGAEQYIRPVMYFEHAEIMARLERVEYRYMMDEIHEKRVQLAKVKQEIKSISI